MQGTISSIPTELRTKIGNVFRRHLRASVCLLCVKCAPQWLWKCSMNENCINQLKFKFEVYSCFTVFFSTVGSHYDSPWRALSYLVKIKRGTDHFLLTLRQTWAHPLCLWCYRFFGTLYAAFFTYSLPLLVRLYFSLSCDDRCCITQFIFVGDLYDAPVSFQKSF